jgi:23S rRNA pseudouridine955/2504/2580 synthase/23S rRNA pseudouridine1911/1915/1917 synthase
MIHHDNRTREIIVTRADEGEAITRYLAGRFTYQTVAEWAHHIADGRITLNGKQCPEDRALTAGDRISFTPPEYDEPEVNSRYTILHEDANFLFVDKPPLLPCHPGGIYLRNTLWTMLSAEYGTVNLINRLDRETSGVVIVARTKEAAALTGALMCERLIDKNYLALVEGDFPERIEASGYLVPDTSSPIRKKLVFVREESRGREEYLARDKIAADGQKGIFAQTTFTGQGNWAPGLSLVRAIPVTGRTHQIRATLEALGFPLAGDKLYGKDPLRFLRFIDGTLTDQDRTELRMDHQALHCTRIAFTMPDGTAYDVSARPPETWNTVTHLQ